MSNKNTAAAAKSRQSRPTLRDHVKALYIVTLLI